MIEIYAMASRASFSVSTVGIIVVIPTSSRTSFTPSSQLDICINPSLSSRFEKTSAIYPIDLELRYLRPARLKRIFLSEKSPICS
jgi:hypothetical protein